TAPSPSGPAAPAKPAPSLLSGLNALQTPGPAPGTKAPGAGAAAGPGLEATAIQRTVRKYSPAVRQNCWQRALNARAAGVPSSAKVTATITVDASGRVQAVSATGAPRGYPGLAHCIEEAVKGWAFPRSMGETVTNVPFVFVGQ
ncbi:MAG: AgmX/PglI C-terminal domain-containing protein, partial [Deltaproteobacteria bacterium]